MKKILLTLISITAISLSVFSQNVNIPDPYFKAYLLANKQINTSGGEISVQQAAAYNGDITINNGNIKSLVGMEAFINLTVFYYISASVESIDLSKNVNLVVVDLAASRVKILDLSNNEALKTLRINQCETLASLIMGNKPTLTKITCQNNAITSLDLSGASALKELNCYNNKITSLNINGAVALTSLYCNSNQLKNLDLSTNTLLTNFDCTHNSFTSLDVRKNTLLQQFLCYSNSLTSLDLSKNLSLTLFNCTYNPDLKCIGVSDIQNKPNWYKDYYAVYSTDCYKLSPIEDEAVNKSKTVGKIYNIQGQEVSEYYQGLVIYQYTDGSTEKVIQE